MNTALPAGQRLVVPLLIVIAVLLTILVLWLVVSPALFYRDVPGWMMGGYGGQMMYGGMMNGARYDANFDDMFAACADLMRSYRTP
jgi:hypothetical protein